MVGDGVVRHVIGILINDVTRFVVQWAIHCVNFGVPPRWGLGTRLKSSLLRWHERRPTS